MATISRPIKQGDQITFPVDVDGLAIAVTVNLADGKLGDGAMSSGGDAMTTADGFRVVNAHRLALEAVKAYRATHEAELRELALR